MKSNPKLLVVVGTPGSGKDLLIRAVNDLGVQHSRIVSKHTSRVRRTEDGNEMICPGDEGFNLENCDIIYNNYQDSYGINTSSIWQGIKEGVFQVVVVSNIEAINRLKSIFGSLVILIYVHSEMNASEYAAKELNIAKNSDTDYIVKRQNKYRDAYDIYLNNFSFFDHVLIYSGAPEDLYDQIFRLFRAYEKGEI